MKRRQTADPLSDESLIIKYRKKHNIDNVDKQDSGSILKDMLLNPSKADYEPPEEKLIEERESLEFVNQFLKDQQQQQSKRKILTGESSDSDSEVEENKKQLSKTKHKKRISDAKNIRKKEKISQDIPPGIVPDTVQIPETVFDNKSKKIRGYDSDEEEEQEEEEEEEIDSEERNHMVTKINGMSAKQLQDLDQNNPLPLQKLFYLDKNDRKLQKSSINKEDLDEFENNLHNMNFTLADMALVYEVLKKSSYKSWIPKDRKEMLAKQLQILEIVPRALEESYMRTPIAGERRCVNDERCEGCKIPGCRSVILTEFLSNSERMEKETKGKLPVLRKPCILCMRYFIAYFYVNARSECGSIKSTAIYGKHCNIVDKKGEYCLEECIMSSSLEYQGLPAPVVLHCRYKYEQVERNGITWYIQHYKKPEDQNINGLVFP